MKTDQELIKDLREKKNIGRLLTEDQALYLMGKARTEVINDAKKKIPDMKALQDEFTTQLAKSKNDPAMAACYKRLTPDKAAWVWFTAGAAAVLKKFKTE
ncbi:MAG TPA: hypothetical protein VK207_08960 [Bacteroidales bacterium]|nr:hypothetical protein [Bacteroidales bacterium]